MAIDAKISFINQIETGLATEVTLDAMNRVMRIVADTLEGYEMRETFETEDREDDLFNSFISALRVQGRSEKTIERYKFVITRLLDAVKLPIRRITVYHIRAYITAEKERGIADSTLEGLRQVFSSFFGWLHREGLIERNPVSNIGTIKCPKKQKGVFTDDEIHRLMMNCTTGRNRAIIAFLRSTGCRISELTELNRNAIDLNAGECIVRGKGDKERVVFLDDVAKMYLRQYLSTRRDFLEPLFIGYRMERLQPGGIRIMLNEVAERAGVEHVHPHKFRRTLATNLARRGMPIQEIAAILGHDKIETTMEYIVMQKDDIKQAHRRYG